MGGILTILTLFEKEKESGTITILIASRPDAAYRVSRSSACSRAGRRWREEGVVGCTLRFAALLRWSFLLQLAYCSAAKEADCSVLAGLCTK